MKKLLALAALGLAFIAPVWAASDLAKLPSVKAFYADAGNCMYMVDNPAEVADSVSQRFSKAADAAVDAMLREQASMTRDKALLQLRKGCDATLKAAAK